MRPKLHPPPWFHPLPPPECPVDWGRERHCKIKVEHCFGRKLASSLPVKHRCPASCTSVTSRTLRLGPQVLQTLTHTVKHGKRRRWLQSPLRSSRWSATTWRFGRAMRAATYKDNGFEAIHSMMRTSFTSHETNDEPAAYSF